MAKELTTVDLDLGIHSLPKVTVVTPFSRKQNIELMSHHLEGKVNWIVLVDNPELKFPDWVKVKLYDKPIVKEGECISNILFNKFIDEGLDDDTQYILLCDDDFVEDGFWDKIPDNDVVIVGMKRDDRVKMRLSWEDWKTKTVAMTMGQDILEARPEEMQIAKVGGEQLIIKGKILKNYRYGLSPVGDGEMVMQVVKDHKVTYVPDAYVLFNFLEDGRYISFRRKPIVLFVGDFYCAGVPAMGKSEWEGNIWASLASTEAVDIARFHFDKYYYHYGKRGDEAFRETLDRIKPDYIIAVMYKSLGSDPTAISQDSLEAIKATGVPLITIWGDLEAEEQRSLAKQVEPYCTKIVGTANKEVVESLGYIYLHVPKDPRIFNNPNKERNIDVVFSGSFGLGREERREALKYLLDNDIQLLAGGSEGGEHFTTEEYADRYKRSKIALSFSKARGMNVVNARVFEVMNCGAMLLEQESPELAKLYTEGEDYVVWKTKEDLLEKVRYYLANEKERETIANNGYRKTQELYSSRMFWEKALSK